MATRARTGISPGVLWALFALGGCGAPQLTPLGPVPAGVTVDLQEHLYEIRGTTDDQLLQQMVALGPAGRGYRYRWRIAWRYDYGEVDQPGIAPDASAETVCALSNIELTLTFTRTLPHWEPPESASEDLAMEWDEFMQALRLHGEGHRDIAVAASREIIKRLRKLETPNCAFIKREARSLVDEAIETANGQDREYEESTQGGRTQGVSWPRRGEPSVGPLVRTPWRKAGDPGSEAAGRQASSVAALQSAEAAHFAKDVGRIP